MTIEILSMIWFTVAGIIGLSLLIVFLDECLGWEESELTEIWLRFTPLPLSIVYIVLLISAAIYLFLANK